MDDGKGIIVVKLDKRPITYRRKIYARLSGVSETTSQFGKNFIVFISYEVAVLMNRSHAGHGAVWSQRLRSFVFKPLIKSERYKFHITLTARLRGGVFSDPLEPNVRYIPAFHSTLPINYYF